MPISNAQDTVKFILDNKEFFSFSLIDPEKFTENFKGDSKLEEITNEMTETFYKLAKTNIKDFAPLYLGHETSRDSVPSRRYQVLNIAERLRKNFENAFFTMIWTGKSEGLLDIFTTFPELWMVFKKYENALEKRAKIYYKTKGKSVNKAYLEGLVRSLPLEVKQTYPAIDTIIEKLRELPTDVTPRDFKENINSLFRPVYQAFNQIYLDRLLNKKYFIENVGRYLPDISPDIPHLIYIKFKKLYGKPNENRLSCNPLEFQDILPFPIIINNINLIISEIVKYYQDDSIQKNNKQSLLSRELFLSASERLMPNDFTLPNNLFVNKITEIKNKIELLVKLKMGDENRMLIESEIALFFSQKDNKNLTVDFAEYKKDMIEKVQEDIFQKIYTDEKFFSNLLLLDERSYQKQLPEILANFVIEYLYEKKHHESLIVDDIAANAKRNIPQMKPNAFFQANVEKKTDALATSKTNYDSYWEKGVSPTIKKQTEQRINHISKMHIRHLLEFFILMENKNKKNIKFNQDILRFIKDILNACKYNENPESEILGIYQRYEKSSHLSLVLGNDIFPFKKLLAELNDVIKKQPKIGRF